MNQRYGASFMRRTSILGLVTVSAILFAPMVSASDVSTNYDASFESFLPLLLALVVAYFVRRWFIPQQLKNLQVAFEIEDDLYEVHRITRTLRDSRRLLKAGRVGYGVLLYMMGLTGVLILIAELLFDAEVFSQLNLYIIATLILIPVLISPWESLNSQLASRRRDVRSSLSADLIRRVFTLALLIIGTALVLAYGVQVEGTLTPTWLAFGMLAFMAPTIFAYGRIMGASWNMLLINKWRTTRGRKNPIDPDKNGVIGRLFSFLLVLFLLTMPITALNGILTVFYVMVNAPPNSEEILNYGGIIGYSLFVRIDAISEFLFHWEFIKSLPQFLSLYLTLNIAIVGLAFIFELTRNLILGGQSFGGMFGVTLDTPREIRAEKSAQARQLTFAFAGFSGYTVLLLILVCYKEFGSLMPLTATLEANDFDEEMRLLTVWLFIAVGQLIFLMTWLLSISKFGHLLGLRFDLNPDERREGAVLLEGGDRLQNLVENAAFNEDLDMLIRIQTHDFPGDQALIRQEQSRASMWEKALRGLWPEAIEESRKLLAQSGGDNDEARMLIATGYMALRRLDAAREALHGLQQPEGYDEPEILSFICEWLDPWRGAVTEDDIWDWENNSTIDYLQMLQTMMKTWKPRPAEMMLHNDKLSQTGQLSMIALLRGQRRYDEALELSLSLVRSDPIGVRPRLATALCLLDTGQWHDAKTVLDELIKSDSKDPRVQALAVIFGYGTKGREHMEVSLLLDDQKETKKWMDAAPVNAYAALLQKGGLDEAMNANVLIASHEATRRAVPPRYSPGILMSIFQYLVLIPVWFVLGILAYQEIGDVEGLAVLSGLLFLHYSYRRVIRQQEHQIRHRDQRGMIKYARRLKRFKAVPQASNIPIGNHLLLSGILVTVNGVVLDIGYPAWMFERLSKEPDKKVRQRLRKRSMALEKGKTPRVSTLGKAWWLKRPKEHGESGPMLERSIGPVAYRGRTNYIRKKEPQALNDAAEGKETQLQKRFIPRNTIRSERP
ncbi:MAG: tetratricopeptide repeat protein [Candidatus Poseidoniales archaeon]|nr:MAG: tetratricopeptide repeat protein [Candidatus Poseidoniales archaeon]